ncbi:MAG: AAA family ATPase, partial [Pseudomonadota bacterium]|nr:AAA family ATPase [Pseudomonadota bacterium]
MFISKIKLLGFKSFSDETTLTFDSDLNGIIGPNGSGKSNVVEAIKWVMGENSSKSLRGSGMNDIIFSGSTTKASKNIAAVTLFLKADTKDISSSCKKFIKSGNIEVERQIVRDTGSTYRINGKEVRAKDVQFLFADLSSGSRASNIIDQGSVGNLIIQKPAERRRILDEAAGISGISARKTESINKLEATKRNLARLDDILLDNKERLSKLRKQAATAKKYKEANDKIVELNKEIAFAKLQNAILNNKNIKKSLEEISNKYLEKNKYFEELENLKKETTKKIDKLNHESNIINQDSANKINMIEKINIEISNNSKQLTSLKNLKEQINKNQSFQNEILENSLSRLTQLKSEMLNYRNFSNNKSFKSAEEEYSKLQKKFLSSNESLEHVSSKLLSKKEIVTNKEYEKQLLKKKLTEIQNELTILKKSLEQKEIKYKATDYFLNTENNKSKITEIN